MPMGAFFLRDLRGGAEVDRTGSGSEDGGAVRRALKALMNSRAMGESPRRLVRCSAAASLGRVAL